VCPFALALGNVTIRIRAMPDNKNPALKHTLSCGRKICGNYGLLVEAAGSTSPEERVQMNVTEKLINVVNKSERKWELTDLGDLSLPPKLLKILLIAHVTP